MMTVKGPVKLFDMTKTVPATTVTSHQSSNLEKSILNIA